MIAKPFDTPRPADANLAKGWEAEKQMAFYLARAFEATGEVAVFNGLRFPTNTGDFAQIDHLILHRHGMVIVESKATGDGTGLFEVDALGQWTRKAGPRSPTYNITSPVAQGNVQADALRHLLDQAEPPLLDKVVGLLQQHFKNFPIVVMVALSDKARLGGRGAASLSSVMKAELIVAAVRTEIDSHRRHAGFIGAFRDNRGDRATYTLSDAAMHRTIDFLLGHHTPPRLAAPVSPLPAPSTPAPIPATLPSAGAKRLEALTCRHCRSIRVAPVYRKDYCLLCEECGKYTPLARNCIRCGKVATIRKRGGEFFRACDKAEGCGQQIAFWVS